MDGSIRIVPLLSVRGGTRAVDFYQAAFGFECRMRMEDPEAGVFAMLALDTVEIWVSDEAPEHGNHSPDTLDGRTTVRLLLVVPDPSATFAAAVAAGAEPISAPAAEHGWLSGRLRDPFGHHWEICRQIEGDPAS